MSDYKWCHGPSCHKSHTQDRIRGSKGSKVLRTKKVKTTQWNRDNGYQYFCSTGCWNDFFIKYAQQCVAIAPRNEPLETPIEDPVKTKHETHYGHTYYDVPIKEKGVDTSMEQDYKGYRKDIYMTQRIHKATNPFSGQSEMLTAEEYAMWKAVMKANETADPNNGDDPTWDIVRKGITWFQKNNAKAYMTLLD